MHSLPYINKSNLAAANKEAESIIAANVAAGIPGQKEAEFNADVAEATQRVASEGGTHTGGECCRV